MLPDCRDGRSGRRGRRIVIVAAIGLAIAAALAPGVAPAKSIVVYEGGSPVPSTYNLFGAGAGRTVQYTSSFPTDLSDAYCVLLPGNTAAFSTPQKDVLKTFVTAGGTVVAMAENQAYPGGPPAVSVMNSLAQHMGAALWGGQDSIDDDYHSTSVIASSVYTAGVTSIGYAFTNRVHFSSPAAPLVGTQNGTTFIGVQQVGQGKFVYSGDTNVFSDYLGAPYVLDDNSRLAKNLCGDVFPPVITIATPASGTPRYKAGDTKTAAWTCVDLDGDVDTDPSKTFATNPVGQAIDTSAGPSQSITKSFSVTCTDLAGNVATKTHEYVVDSRPPSVSISVPGPVPYTLNTFVPAAWSCTDPDNDIASKSFDNEGTTGIGPGGGIYTTSKGTKTYTVSCTDLVGNTASDAVSYTVPNSPPVAAIAAPLDQARFMIGEAGAADWACSDPDGAGDLDLNPLKTFGTVPDGDPLDTTGTVGATDDRSVSVTCTDLEGEVATKTVTYVVDGNPPVASIFVPLDGASYPRGSSQPANWSCTDPNGQQDIKAETATLPVGTPVNTGTMGQKSFSVTCTDQAGNSTTKVVTYSVTGGPPAVTITIPADKATFDQGQVVSPSYSCSDPDGDLKSCVREGASGPLDTSKGGTFKLTVNAEDSAGNKATKTHTYTVKAKGTVAGTTTSPTSTAKKACTSRRQFRIRVKKIKGGHKAVSATVFVNGKKTTTRKGKRITATVTLKGLKKGTYKVRISVKYSNGRTLSYTRKFKTCTPKGK